MLFFSETIEPFESKLDLNVPLIVWPFTEYMLFVSIKNLSKFLIATTLLKPNQYMINQVSDTGSCESLVTFTVRPVLCDFPREHEIGSHKTGGRY